VRLETAEFLIIKGKADVNHEDGKGETPMIIAKRTGKKNMISLLITHGARQPEDLRKPPALGTNCKNGKRTDHLSEINLKKSNSLTNSTSTII
jgi:ankyrin repeat protein